MSTTGGTGHFAQWSFETDTGFHGQVRDNVLYLRNPRKEPHLVVGFDELVTEIGEPVRLRDGSGWSCLDIGVVSNMLRIVDRQKR
jgi:hypothetical protein